MPASVPPPTRVHLRAMAHGGRAVGHPVTSEPGGRSVWFVSGAIPGETVEAVPQRVRRGIVWAAAGTVVTPSPSRRQPPCPLYGRCGGCNWQHMDEAAQSRYRAEVVAGEMRAIGGVEGAGVVRRPVSEKAALGYRRRVKMHYVREGDELRLGFRSEGTHRLVDVERCPVLVPALDRAIQKVRAIARLLPRQGNVVGLHAGGRVVLGLPGVAPDPPVRAAVEALLDDTLVGVELRGRRRRFGVGRTRLDVDGDDGRASVRAGPFTFLQAHRVVNAALVDLVGDALPERTRSVIELYAGAGNLTRVIAAPGRRVTAVEADREAAAFLSALARGLPGRVSAVRRRVQREVARAAERGIRYDVAVVDPPRAGLGIDLARALAGIVDRRVVYVACDPASLARDVRALMEQGFQIVQLATLDMMPQTSHVEVVAVLERPETAGEGA